MRMRMYDSGIVVHDNGKGSYPVQLHRREPRHAPMLFVRAFAGTLYPERVGDVGRP